MNVCAVVSQCAGVAYKFSLRIEMTGSILNCPKTPARRPVFVVRNVDRRPYTIRLRDVASVAAFLHKEDAVKMQELLEAHFRATGAWPDLGGDPQIYYTGAPSTERLLSVDEEGLDEFIGFCHVHYAPVAIITSFKEDEDRKTVLKYYPLNRGVDPQARDYYDIIYHSEEGI